MKEWLYLLLTVLLLWSLTACAAYPAGAVASTPTSTPVTKPTNTPAANPTPIAIVYEGDDLDSGPDSGDISDIRLEGSTATVQGSGATVQGSTITIHSAGTYQISGVLNNGQIVVNAPDKETVTLILNQVAMASSTGAPIHVIQADKVIISLADDSENHITDNRTGSPDAQSSEPHAAIFSTSDLTIKGNGTLTVQAGYHNGIASKDDLKITGGHITIQATNDGLKGRDSVAIKDGTITINAGGDGIRSDNDEKVEKGYISIEGGVLNITAGQDGIQAETGLTINGGQITLATGGGSANSSDKSGWGNWGSSKTTADSASAKGLKASVDITITGGSIHINSSDDAIHSNNSITIRDGDIWIASGDDGLHADASLTIYGGKLDITQCYEGLESATIAIHGGVIRLTSRDDGINIVGGNDGSALNGRPGQNPFAVSANTWLEIHGGYILIDAVGDGIDVNGTIRMTDGIVIINGPTNNGNGALDYDGGFTISSGFLVAAGSASMAQAPDTSSTQYSLMQTWTSPLPAGTLVHIQTQDGQNLLTFAPTKTFQNIVFSSPDLKNGLTCLIYSGGSSTGSATDGLYSGGIYTPGVQAASLTLSGIVTGASRSGFPGGGMRPPAGRP